MKPRVLLLSTILLLSSLNALGGPFIGKDYHSLYIGVSPFGIREAWCDESFTKDLFDGKKYYFEPAYGISATYLSTNWGFAWGYEADYEMAKFSHYVVKEATTDPKEKFYDGKVDKLSGASAALFLGAVINDGHRFNFPLLFSFGGEYAFAGDGVCGFNMFLGVKLRFVGYVTNKVGIWGGGNASIGFGGIMTTSRYLDFGIAISL